MAQSRRPIILSLTTMHESGMSLLREAGELRMASGARSRDPPARGRRGRRPDDPDRRASIDAALAGLRRPTLKVVGRHGVGYDQIDIQAATERGIQVVYTPGANTESVCRARLRDDDRAVEALPAG